MNSGEIDYSKKLAEVDEELNEEDYSKKLKEINETPTENETKTYYYPQNGNEISHRESFSLEENINEVPPVSNNQDLQRRSLTVRILSIVDAIFSLYCLFLKRWMVAGGVFFALIGFWGALKYQKYFVLVVWTKFFFQTFLTCFSFLFSICVICLFLC